LNRAFRWTGFAGGLCIALLLLSFLALNTWPVLGAQGADLLRNLIGDKAVAGMEMKFNQIQDDFHKFEYQLGLKKPAAPWKILPLPTSSTLGIEIVTTSPEIQTPTAFQPTPIPAHLNTPEPTFTPIPTPWQPVRLTPLAAAEGEGIWSAYIQDTEGYTVAYRTFLQPDPTRPYTMVAIVAIDLTRTRLHFVLGSIEPAGDNTQPRTGAITGPDRVANVLLAAFNGGFKARHGQFGAMADGIIALPPREGLGTLIIYENGKVSLGEWTPDMTIEPDMLAIRQNGPLVIHQNKINPRIYNNSPQDWGYTINDVSPTMRSGIGLSVDDKTLFYFCGPSLSMEMLAKSMLAAGAWNAIQLDINNYWTLFVKMTPSGSDLIVEPLIPRLMVENLRRYLWNFSRDYFYITSAFR